jgi:hypothetical protein
MRLVPGKRAYSRLIAKELRKPAVLEVFLWKSLLTAAIGSPFFFV